jgi:hypothetical protein
MTVCGRCLCGAVTYEIALPADRFVYCHCSRCRKATGCAHSANIYVKPAAFRWTNGENKVGRFDLPEARSFAIGFCIDCGAPVPHWTRSGRAIVVPAGSLDNDPGVKPTHIYISESRAPWAVSTDELQWAAQSD